MRTAFKEWAIVVDELGRGEQILILRKGGLEEGREGFRLEHHEFLLFPTLFHQQRESVRAAAQSRFDQLLPQLPPPELIRLEFYAEVVQSRRLESLSAAEALRGQHCWRDDVIAKRFNWGGEPNIFAVALRVHQLTRPVELPMSPVYAGCKSWVELEQDISTADAVPVLGQQAFDHRLSQFLTALNPAAPPAC